MLGNVLSLGDGELPETDFDDPGSDLDNRLEVKIMPTTLTVTHVSTKYIVQPTTDQYGQRLDQDGHPGDGFIGTLPLKSLLPLASVWSKTRYMSLALLMPIFYNFQ